MPLNDFTGGKPPTNSNGRPQADMGSLLSSIQNGFDAEDILINYNDKFKNADPALFRNEILGQVMAVLLAKDKPNALLVGPAGVGKTRIVEELSRLIENDDPLVPETLYDSVIYELPLSSLVAGSGIVGQLEEKVKAVIQFAEDPDQKAILFIDEIHQLVNGHQSYEKIAQILKPALSRGNLKVIGATTTQEAKNFMDDPALNRRFTRIIVDEFTTDQTLTLLDRVAPSYIKHYGNQHTISQDILESIVHLGDQYSKAGSHRPDTALTLLDRALADSVVDRSHRLQLSLEQGNDNLYQILLQQKVYPLTAKQVRNTAMRIMTGHSQKIDLQKDHLLKALEPIKGQDNVLENITSALMRDNLGLYPRKRPLTFLFAGKSGVGKTEVSKIIAQEVTGMKPIILNLTEYHDPASINRIIGSPAGYVGSDSNSELPFDILETNPYQLILLDEFEKADKSVQRLFMAAFEEGKIKTSRGSEIDFSKSIIIATTNASHTDNHTGPIGFGRAEHSNDIQNVVTDLSSAFDVELLNRFNYILTFNALDEAAYREILADTYARDIARIKAESQRTIDLSDELSDSVLDELTEKTYVPDFGARPAKKAIKDYIESHFLS